MQRWLQSITLSLGGAGAGFAGTLVIVWLFGLSAYADYLIDLAKISALQLLLEALPNGYTLFRQQRDEIFAQAYPAFYALMAIVITLLSIGLAGLGFFEQPNIYLIAYVGLAVLQRYLDCQLQALGHLEAFYRIAALTNVLRVVFLTTGALVLGHDRDSSASAVGQLLWGSLALALLLSLLFAWHHHAALFRSLVDSFNSRSLKFLWKKREAYRPYYVNSVLKRAKDTMLPMLFDALSVDKALVGLIFVYTKSFDVVSGQLRVIEAAFTNLAHRVHIATDRVRIAWIAAGIGQPACILVAAILLWRDGLGVNAIIPAILISFSVYPYVFEILARNDALASERPYVVTTSLVVYVAILSSGLVSLSFLELLAPLPIAFILLIAQCASIVSYRLRA